MLQGWNELYTWLNLHASWVPLIIFMTACLEALAVVGIVVPGIPMMFGLSLIAGRAGIDVSLIFAAGIAGALLGDGISFWLGKYFQHGIEEIWPFRTHPQWLQQGEAFFHRHGGKSIIIGRFIGPLRTFVPLCAGILNMPGWRFTAMNILSTLAWAPVHILPGYLLGSAFDDPLMPGRLQIWFLLGLVLAIFVLIRLLLLLHDVGEPWLRRLSHRLPLHRWSLIDQAPSHQLGALFIALTTLTAYLLLYHALASPQIRDLDHLVSQRLLALHQPFMDYLFVALSVLGYHKPMLALGGCLIFYFMGRAAYGTALISFIVGLTGLWLLPALLGGLPGSFPSLPALSTVMIWGFIGVVIARSLPHAQRVRPLALVLTLIVLTLVASLYLGRSRLSEVLGGVLLGGGLLSLIRYAYYRSCRLSLGGQEVSLMVSIALVLISIGMVLPEMDRAIHHYAPLQSSLQQHNALRQRRRHPPLRHRGNSHHEVWTLKDSPVTLPTAPAKSGWPAIAEPWLLPAAPTPELPGGAPAPATGRPDYSWPANSSGTESNADKPSPPP